jgi:uncharacterized surface protein with fasciclin (FAS1) repeats
MSDRGPYGSDPDPTEVFPPLRNEPPSTPPANLPPIGTERDPDPTRVMPPTEGDVPTTLMPPTTGGPYDPGPPYGGPPGGGGGGDEPPFEPEPDPWYRQPGPVAALIAGVAALVLGLIALLIWTSDDGDDTSDNTLPTVASTSSTTTSSTVPASTSTTTTTVPETTTTTSTTTTTTTTTVPATTTTTVPATTTTAAPTTTVAPTTTTTTLAPTTTLPPGQGLLDEIRANPDLSTFADALSCTGLDDDVLTGAARTVLAPDNDAFVDTPFADPCDDPDATEPILLFQLVSIDLTAQEIFSSTTLQTLGGDPVPVDRAAQTIGTGGTKIVEADIQAGDGYIQVVDSIIQQ